MDTAIITMDLNSLLIKHLYFIRLLQKKIQLHNVMLDILVFNYLYLFKLILVTYRL